MMMAIELRIAVNSSLKLFQSTKIVDIYRMAVNLAIGKAWSSILGRK
jgi:hypothetical protein